MYQSFDFEAELTKLPKDKRLVATLETERALYLKSLFLTAKYLLNYSEINWYTHGDMISVLESERPNRLIVMPRGTFKTSVGVVAYIVWRILNNFNTRILLDSELYTNSKKTLREVSQHLTSPEITRLFGSFRGQGVWNESEIFISQRSIIRKEATVTVSGIGAQKTSQHYDEIIADDLNSPKNSNTQEGRQKVIDHYRMYTSLLDPGGRKTLIGTRYHDLDCIGYVLRNEIFLPDNYLDSENEDYEARGLLPRL